MTTVLCRTCGGGGGVMERWDECCGFPNLSDHGVPLECCNNPMQRQEWRPCPTCQGSGTMNIISEDL